MNMRSLAVPLPAFANSAPAESQPDKFQIAKAYFQAADRFAAQEDAQTLANYRA